MAFLELLLCIYIFFLFFTFLLNQYERMNAPLEESFDLFIFFSIVWEGITTIFVFILDLIGFFFNYDSLFREGWREYPVIFIPGYSANRGYFFPYAFFLNRAGFRVFTMPPVPFYCNIYYLSEILQKKVESVLKQTGASKVILIGHSMGGLIGRYYIQRLGGDEKVAALFTISTPHRGTKVSVFGSGYSAKEMVPESNFLKDLNRDMGKYFKKVRLVSLGTKADNLVIPYTHSFAKIGRRYTLDFLGHNSMMFSLKVFEIIVAEAEELERISGAKK